MTIQVQISDGDSTATVAGAVVSLRAEPSGAAAGSGSTGAEGLATFDIDPAFSARYSATATWPSGSDADPTWSQTMEFLSTTTNVVTVDVAHPYRFVTERITATAGTQPVANLTGGTLSSFGNSRLCTPTGSALTSPTNTARPIGLAPRFRRRAPTTPRLGRDVRHSFGPRSPNSSDFLAWRAIC